MTSPMQPTMFHIVFTEAETDPAFETGWHQAIRESFPHDRTPKFRMEVQMTRAEFMQMTGTPDIEDHIGYVLEHRDGPGIFGIDTATFEVDRLSDAVMEVDNSLSPVNTEELTAEGWQALLHVMKETLDMDWKVQREIINDSFVERHQNMIGRFMRPHIKPSPTIITVLATPYRPFALGRSPHQPLKCELEAEGPHDLGMEVQGYVVTAPDGQVFVAEATTGAIVGTNLEAVRDDVASSDPATIQGQIEQARAQLSHAADVSPKEFWRLFRRR